MDMQALIDAMNRTGELTRSSYHLTLGELIDALEAGQPETEVRFDHGAGVGEEDSYRGYYSDLAFENGPPIKAAELARRCKAAAGSTYTGYKGGEFNMGLTTPLWNAPYGCTGLAIVGAKVVNDALVLETRDVGG